LIGTLGSSRFIKFGKEGVFGGGSWAWVGQKRASFRGRSLLLDTCGGEAAEQEGSSEGFATSRESSGVGALISFAGLRLKREFDSEKALSTSTSDDDEKSEGVESGFAKGSSVQRKSWSPGIIDSELGIQTPDSGA
jgi:hypothetical protein